MSVHKHTPYNAHLLFKNALEKNLPIILEVKVNVTIIKNEFSRHPRVSKCVDGVVYNFRARGLTTPATHWVFDVSRMRERTNAYHNFNTDKNDFESVKIPCQINQSLSKTLFEAACVFDKHYLEDNTASFKNINSLKAKV